MTDEMINFRFEWPFICKMACRAMCLGVSFNDLVELALKEQLHEMKKP